MDNLLQTLIILATIVSVITLALKSYFRKDMGIASAIIPRLYLIGVLVYDFFVNSVTPVYFHIGVLIVFLGDIIANIFIMASPKFRSETYATHLLDLLADLKVKYEFVVEHIPLGIYTINEYGKFEFANEELSKILKCKREDLIGKSAYDFFLEEHKEDLKQKIRLRLTTTPRDDYKSVVRDCEGNIIPIRIIAKKTENGHPTITGCVIRL